VVRPCLANKAKAGSHSSIAARAHLRQLGTPALTALNASATAAASRLKGLRPCPVRTSAPRRRSVKWQLTSCRTDAHVTVRHIGVGKAPAC